jgi:hypothetical protein
LQTIVGYIILVFGIFIGFARYRYPLLLLDDEYYIRARMFYKYLSQVQNDYRFKLPEQEPITLHRSDHYFKSVELFAYEEHVFVLLRKINYRATIAGNKLILERET